MHFTSILSLLALCSVGSSCGVTLPMRRDRSTREADRIRMKRELTTQSPSDDNTTHWTVAQNTRQMQITDDAFIAKDFASFNHHPNATMYYTGGVVMSLAEHITDLRLTFSTYSDVAPHNHNYRILFGDADWTVAMSSVTATNDGALSGLSGEWLPPTQRTSQFDMLTIARWNEGLMMEEFLWTDSTTASRHLGLLPTKPPTNAPDLELNAYTLPLSTQPTVDDSAANKERTQQAIDALNAGSLDPQSLHLSPNITVYGLDDKSLDLQGYLASLSDFKTAFPDLHTETRQVIGQGDWTATVSLLSGTHAGSLTLPVYLAPAPVPATGERFELLHYTICRWQDGVVTDMKVFNDLFGIMGSLGLF